MLRLRYSYLFDLSRNIGVKGRECMALYPLPLLAEEPNVWAQCAGYLSQKTPLIPKLAINIDTIRQKSIFSHPPFELASFNLNVVVLL